MRMQRRTLLLLFLIGLAFLALSTLVAAQSSTGASNSTNIPPREKTEEEQAEEEAESVAEHPFLEVNGLINGSWFKVSGVHVESAVL